MIKSFNGKDRDEVHKRTNAWIVEKGNSIKDLFVTEATLGRLDYRSRKVFGDVE